MRLRPLLGLTSAGALALGACDPPAERRPVEMVPIGTEVGHGPAERPRDPSEVGVNSAVSPEGAASTGAGCALEGADLAEVFRAACEADEGTSPPTAWKELEVSAQAAAGHVKAGASVDVEVTLRNRGAEPLSFALAGLAEPSFDLATADARGRRVDVPAGKTPKVKGAATLKTYVVTLAPGQAARGRATWEAAKMRWAPERAKEVGDHPFPRAAAGPLAPGRYVVVVHPAFAAPPSGKERPPSGRFDVTVTR